jgi:hypothetical protein
MSKTGSIQVSAIGLVPALYPQVKKGRFYTPYLESGAIKKRVIKSHEDYLLDFLSQSVI